VGRSTQYMSWVRLIVALAATMVLAGCNEQQSADTATDAMTGITVSTAPLVLVGVPPTEITAYGNYFFQPQVAASTDSITYSIVGKPEWLSFNGSNGMLNGTPYNAAIGTSADITITATTAKASGTIGPFRIRVMSQTAPATLFPNVPPSLAGLPAAVAIANQPYDFLPAAADAEGATLQYSIVNRPTWATFDTTTGRLSGAPGTNRIGVYGGILIRVSDGIASVSLPVFAIEVTATAGSGNAAPVIAGKPAATVVAGSAYSFMPSASDANGDALTFQIQNKPAWATFNTGTGLLYGSPGATDAGSYSNVLISANDGKASATLNAFTITVNKVSAGSGSATLYWLPPTENTDGSALTDLAGYNVYYGKNPAILSYSANAFGAANTRFEATNLDAGTWYFSVRPYNSAGVESDQPELVSKTI
jgi:Putative Ig domain